MLSSARFTRDDFREYLRWFADPALNRRLGPLDEAWLEHVLADVTGLQLSFFLAGALVAVAGIALPPTPDLPYGITTLVWQERPAGGSIECLSMQPPSLFLLIAIVNMRTTSAVFGCTTPAVLQTVPKDCAMFIEMRVTPTSFSRI